MSSIFGRGTQAGPETMSMDAVLTRALCDNRKELNKIQVELAQMKDILEVIKDLLMDNLEQSQRVSGELQEAGRQLCEVGCQVEEAMRHERR